MRTIERNDISKRTYSRVGQFCKEHVEIGLEFKHKHLMFRIRRLNLLCRRDVRGIDDYRPKCSHLLDSSIRYGINLSTVAEIDLPGNSYACSSQVVPRFIVGINIQELRVVAMESASALLCRSVTRINSRQCSKQSSRIGNRATERANGVLAVRNGDHTRTAGQSDRRLYADNRVC